MINFQQFKLVRQRNHPPNLWTKTVEEGEDDKFSTKSELKLKGTLLKSIAQYCYILFIYVDLENISFILL